MVLQSEIKDFVKKVLLLGVLLSFVVNLLFTYFSGLSDGVSAAGNDAKFQRAGVSYLGTTGVAIALNVGMKEKMKQDVPVTAYADVMPIAEVLADKGVGQTKLISTNMVAASEYLNILKTDVNKLLDSATDRVAMLDSFIDQLEYRYKTTNTYLTTLTAQISELQGAVTTSDAKIESLKNDLTAAYKNLDYDKTEEVLTNYIDEKNKNTYARTYLVFLGRFVSTYQTLNAYNKTLLDTLINNHDALAKNATVVIPDSGTDLMKQLNLVKTEAEWKSR